MKENFTDNRVHNILRPFDGWADFPFTTSETKHCLLIINWYIRVASLVAKVLKILGNREIPGKYQIPIELLPIPP